MGRVYCLATAPYGEASSEMVALVGVEFRLCFSRACSLWVGRPVVVAVLFVRGVLNLRHVCCGVWGARHLFPGWLRARALLAWCKKFIILCRFILI